MDDMKTKERETMDRKYLTARPKRREENLIVREVGDEVIVYDQDRHKAHCLNAEAAAIWNACNGNRDGRAILECVHGGVIADEHRVAYLVGLRELQKNHLLDRVEEGSEIRTLGRTSRRELLARVGKAAAVTLALPAVMSIVSPTPAEADSCLASGQTCTSSAQCCSGLCTGTCA